MLLRRRSTVALVSVLFTGVLVTGGGDASQATVVAGSMASAIRSVPVKPADCTKTQIANLDIDHCALLQQGTPDERGFPVPPFPVSEILTTPLPPDQPWVDLQAGSTGPIVTLLQRVLKTDVPALLDDGKFGTSTTNALKIAQARLLLPVTGIVDAATATALGILVVATVGPFPPAGWVWNGNSYNGSPALAEWEARLMKGTVTSDPDVSPLIEGFLADARKGGYRVDEAGSYSFRCVATSVRNCAGQTFDEISFHSWGAAVDVNWTQNPLQYVTHPTDACSAPAELAQPDWIIALAQHWGLFWGGWYSCPKANQHSVVKDPHHFEFRGTPELARAIAARNAAPGAPTPTIPGVGDLLLNCGDRGGVVATVRSLLAPADRPAENANLEQTFTPALATAVAKVQTRLGLAPTGAWDAPTARAFGVTVHHTEVFPVLHINSCGAYVTELQTKLGMTPTGTFGSTTMKTLRTYQRAHGLGPTGVVDTATAVSLGLRLAESGTPPSSTSSTSSTSSSSTSSTTSTTAPPVDTGPDPDAPHVTVPLSSGARGASVTELQRALTAAGYATPETGRFGAVTARNLKAFKKDNKLPLTTTLTIAAAQLLGLVPVPKVPTKYGQRGDHVLLLQLALIEQGATIAADGRFGPGTRAALTAFQQQHGLKVTGILDAATAAQLGW